MAWLARGFGKGDVLAIMAPNIPEYAIVFHGVPMAGGMVTTINPTYTAEEVDHQLNDAGATLLVTIAMFLEMAREAAEGTEVEEIFIIDRLRATAHASPSLLGDPSSRCRSTSRTTSWCCPTPRARPGCPKGVMLTHRNLVANLAQIERVHPTRRGRGRPVACCRSFTSTACRC